MAFKTPYIVIRTNAHQKAILKKGLVLYLIGRHKSHKLHGFSIIV